MVAAAEYDSNVAETELLINGLDAPLQIVVIKLVMSPPSSKSITLIVVETVSIQPAELVI